MFARLYLPGKWSARRSVHSHKESFTGLTETDEHLRRVQLLPTYISQLQLTREEKRLPRIKRRGVLDAMCARALTVHATELSDTMESTIKYPHANY